MRVVHFVSSDDLNQFQRLEILFSAIVYMKFFRVIRRRGGVGENDGLYLLITSLSSTATTLPLLSTSCSIESLLRRALTVCSSATSRAVS